MNILNTEDVDIEMLEKLLPGFKFDFRVPINSEDAIIPIHIGNETYDIWSVNHIKPYLIKFLKFKVPNCIVSQEINDIDFIIIGIENNIIIPVELQRTVTGGRNSFQSAHLEKSIRKQVDENIKSYGICWLFFDYEYIRYFQNGNLNKNVNLDMNWCIEYMKENTLKTFTIKYDGSVEELKIEDFNFLKEIHSDDEIILDVNKLKIYRNVLKGYNFTQEKVSKFYEEYDELLIENRNKDNELLLKNKKLKVVDLLTKSKNIEISLHANIIRALRTLPGINEILEMRMVERRRLFESGYLGIFELVSSHGNRSIMKFVDKFDICQYFPGYIRNKEMWDRYKNCNLSSGHINDLCRGMYKNVKSVGDY